MKDFFNELSLELAGGALAPKRSQPEAPAPSPLPQAPAPVVTQTPLPAAAQASGGDNRSLAAELSGSDLGKPHLPPLAKVRHAQASTNPSAEDDMRPDFTKDSGARQGGGQGGQGGKKGPQRGRGGHDRRRGGLDFACSVFPEVKPQKIPFLEPGKTRLMPLGGQQVIGKHMIVVQYGDQFVVTDCGMQFAEPHMYGADYSIPDPTALIPVKDKILALLITHGHLDHIGALKHVLPALGFPEIFATPLTAALIKRQLTNVGIFNKCKLTVVNPDSDGLRTLGQFKFEYFRVNHSIPDACGILVQTPSAKIVHCGDYKFDFNPAIDKPADFHRLSDIGSRGIDLVLGESTNSTKAGWTKSEGTIGEELAKAIGQAPGRVIVATFASQVGRVKQVVEAAEKCGRQVFLNGRSMVETVEICKELGLIHSKQGTLQKVSPAIDKMADQKLVVLTTGSQGEENAGLYRMAMGEHPIVKIRPGDTIVMSSSPIPGNERSVIDLLNYLMKLGATVITNEGMALHTSGHCYGEEQKLMYQLMRPKYVLPIHGELFQRVANKRLAVEAGVPAKNVFLLENGNYLELKDGVVEKGADKIICEEMLVDGNGIGTLEGPVVEAREQMMQSGVMVVSFVTGKDRSLREEPRVESRGFVYPHEVKAVHAEVVRKAQACWDAARRSSKHEKDVLQAVKHDLESFVLQKLDREPLVVPVVVMA